MAPTCFHSLASLLRASSAFPFPFRPAPFPVPGLPVLRAVQKLSDGPWPGSPTTIAFQNYNPNAVVGPHGSAIPPCPSPILLPLLPIDCHVILLLIDACSPIFVTFAVPERLVSAQLASCEEKVVGFGYCCYSLLRSCLIRGWLGVDVCWRVLYIV